MQTTFRKTPITPARIAPFRPSVPAKESNKKLPSKVESTEKPREQVSRSAPSSTPFRDISTTTICVVKTATVSELVAYIQHLQPALGNGPIDLLCGNPPVSIIGEVDVEWRVEM